MENGPCEDVVPIENGDIPLLCLFTRGYLSNPIGKDCLPFPPFFTGELLGLRSQVLPHHSVNATPADGAVRANLPLCHCVKDPNWEMGWVRCNIGRSGRMEWMEN